MARALRRLSPVPTLCALFLLVLAALLTGVLSAGPAAAHAEVISITPAQGATVNQVPGSVVLTFGEDIEPTLVRTRLVWPGGASAVTASVAGGVVTVPVGGLPQITALADPNGAYGVVYRVVSKDGHPVSGETSFTVAGAPPGSSQVTATPLHSAASGTSPAATGPAADTGTTIETTSLSHLLILGIGVLLAGGTVLAVVARTRRGVGPGLSTTPSPGTDPPPGTDPTPPSPGTDPPQRTQP